MEELFKARKEKLNLFKSIRFIDVFLNNLVMYKVQLSFLPH